MSNWSAYCGRDVVEGEERSVRELVQEEMSNARIASRRFHAERPRASRPNGNGAVEKKDVESLRSPD